jgi:hypothetical protein
VHYQPRTCGHDQALMSHSRVTRAHPRANSQQAGHRQGESAAIECSGSTQDLFGSASATTIASFPPQVAPRLCSSPIPGLRTSVGGSLIRSRMI